jgi:23S rRNA pseudouridine1911/1915/1917 synthase
MLSIATAKEKLLTTYSILSGHVKRENPNNRIFVVHRLDRDTSGIMMFAKSEEVQSAMQKAWHEAVIERTYVAVVEGLVENDEGTIRSFLKENKALIMYSTKVPGEGDEAITHYKVLRRGEAITLVEVKLETGRKNQIRVHMKELGHPVVGDKKYGAKTNLIGRTCLHARVLAFIHPVNGTEVRYETPVPGRFMSVFARHDNSLTNPERK